MDITFFSPIYYVSMALQASTNGFWDVVITAHGSDGSIVFSWMLCRHDNT